MCGSCGSGQVCSSSGTCQATPTPSPSPTPSPTMWQGCAGLTSGFYSDPQNCNKYHQCAYGIDYVNTCPSGLSPKSPLCVYICMPQLLKSGSRECCCFCQLQIFDLLQRFFFWVEYPFLSLFSLRNLDVTRCNQAFVE